MGDYSHIHVDPITPALGAEIRDIDLARLSEAELAEIRNAFIEYSVLVFRDQTLTVEQHKAFGRSFGPLHVHPGKAHLGLPGDPEIFEIHATAASKHANGEIWHSDLSCEASPPLGSMLYLRSGPAVGGDTLFCDMYAAYESLSDPMKQFLRGLHAFHDGRKDLAGYDIRLRDDQIYPSATHPVIAVHPDSGRPLLFVNPSFTVRIEELSASESASVLDHLYRHYAQQPRCHCRVRQTPGTLVFWDNRSAQHHAVWDYFPSERCGDRVTIAGVPLQAA